MTYISGNGQLSGSKSPWRVSIISDTFWGFINFIVLFFQTMFSPNMTKHGSGYSSDYRPGDGPGGPRKRIGRINHGGGGPSSPGNLPPGGG